MNIFNKLFTALKGGANEMGEALVDDNAITLFEHEIDSAKAELAKAKESEMSLLARKRQAQAQMTLLDEKIIQHEDKARVAAAANKESQALAFAGTVLELNQEKEALTLNLQSMSAHCDKLALQIKRAEANVQDMQNQLSQIKTTESVHKAQESIHASLHGSATQAVSARESLERIKQKQAYAKAKHEVSEELAFDQNGANNLDNKLKAADANKEAAAAALLKKLTDSK